MKTHTLYGECPNCGAMCQPELATATFKPDEDDYSHLYRIDNVETFDAWGVPHECKDK